MKKLLSMLLVVAMLLTAVPLGGLPVAAEAAVFAGGSGTAEDPYLVATEAQLEQVANYLDACFLQVADITLTKSWKPLGYYYYTPNTMYYPGTLEDTPFTGVYDGGGYTISNLNVTMSTRDMDGNGSCAVGLFGRNKGTIRRVTINSGTVKAVSGMGGGIVGWNEGVVEYCANNAAVTADRAGGIAGRNAGTVAYCFNMGSIVGDGVIEGDGPYRDTSGYAGGIVGTGGRVSHCANSGSVKGISDTDSYGYTSPACYAGGIAGEDTVITGCYNVGEAYAWHYDYSPDYSTGEYFDYDYYFCHPIIYDTAFTDCYYISETLTEEQMKLQETYATFDFDNVWMMSGAYEYPLLRGVTLPWGVPRTQGILTYAVTDGYVTITGCDTSVSGSLTIPSVLDGYPVKVIGESAFAKCRLNDVVIPNSVTTIEASAFNSCTKLKTIAIPDSVTSIGAQAFYKTYWLKHICIPDGISIIGASMFYDGGLTSICLPSSVTTVADKAFHSCDALTDVYYTGTADTWSGMAKGTTNTSLEACTIHYGKWVSKTAPTCTEAGSRTFYCPYCEGEYQETIAATSHRIDGLGWTVASPATCEAEGEKRHACLNGCGDAVTAAIPHIGHRANDATWTESVPATCEAEGEEQTTCLHGCGKVFARSVTALGHTADESGWTESVPATCEAEGEEQTVCINGCGKVYTRPVSALGHAADESGWTVSTPPTCTEAGEETTTCLNGCGEVLSRPTAAAGHRFAEGTCTVCGAVKLESDHPYANNTDKTWSHTVEGACQLLVTFSADTQTEQKWDYIYLYDGKGTELGKYTGTELASQTITVAGDTVNIRLTSDDTGDAYGFFATVTGVIEDTPCTHTYDGVSNVCTECGYVDPTDFTYTVTDGNATVTGYTGAATEVTIPAVLGECPVTEIGVYAFRSDSLTSVIIPDSVTSIGRVAFGNCSTLTSLTIGNSVTSIGNGAFEYCSNLTSVVIPDSVTNIGIGAFDSCSNLLSVTIPDSVTSIGSGAFMCCSKLTSVIIPDSVTNIELNTFYRCSNLISVTIPDSVTNIGECAFDCCFELTSVIIPDSVTSIGESAFAYCGKLTHVWYTGSEAEKDAILLGSGNEYLTMAKWHYNTCKGVHIYSNACDSDCNLCDWMREASDHRWDDATCTTPKTCSVCGATKGIALGHKWNDATCTAPKTCAVCGATEGEALGHDWDDATCTTSKACSVCGATEGKALGHEWDGATCTDPKTCSVCGATEGKVLGHKWNNATCTDPKTCSVCGATEGEALGHEWNNATCTDPKTCTTCGETEGEALGHEWDDVTCTTPKTCSVCGETEGEALGHRWYDAPCTIPRTCSVCGETEGEALGHEWDDATCTTPKTCSVCGETKGVASGHEWNEASCVEFRVCTVCGESDSEVVGHTWNDATCTNPKLCSVCGATEGEALGHEWNDATCTAPKTCTVCGKTEGEALGHEWDDATCTTPKTCSVCGVTEGVALGHVWSNPTCTKPTTCLFCGEVRGEALGHTWNEATCTAPKTCSVCGATEGKALSHNFFYVNTEIALPTCTESATNIKKCLLCGQTKVETKPSLGGHKFDSPYCDGVCSVCGETRREAHRFTTTTAKATLSANGKITETCSFCGKSHSKTIYKVTSVAFKKASSTYNGMTKGPAVVVKDSKGKTLSLGTDYTVTYPSGMKAVGTYKVKVVMLGNYSGTKTLTYTINPISVSTCKVSFKKATTTYDGKVKTPAVVVKNANGTTLKLGVHYKVVYPAGMKKVGTYKVKVVMLGNYSGTKTLTYKINPISVSTCKVSFKKATTTYNGKVKTPAVVVKNANGTTLKLGVHYKVVYPAGMKKVGTYKVKVVMLGNYSGTKTLTYTIKK